MSHLYDISRTLQPGIAVWPGDEPFSTTQHLALEAGQSVNLHSVTTTMHVGTHADAPWHVMAEPVHPVDLPLEAYIGPAHVVSVGRRSGGIVPGDLAGADLDGMERLLLHTWCSESPDEVFPQDFPYPSLELADWLIARGVKLVGVDGPSVDAFDSKNLPVHKRLFGAKVVNLEALTLRGVPDGVYELIALPLKIAGVCGSPVRAVLRQGA